jgi:glycosyltransferase involved in cell wall biosynthesis
MKILYYSGMFSGLLPFFKYGKDLITGMPAFFKVFKSFLDDSKIEKLYFFLLIDVNNYGKFSIVTEKRYYNKLVVFPYYYSNRASLLLAVLHAIVDGILLCLRHKITFIYGHGYMSSIGSLVGIISRVKHFRRIYGTFLFDKLEKGKLNILKNDFFEYLSFKLPANGLIITNDGTKGNEVYNRIGNKKTPIYFLLNGIDKGEFNFNKPIFLNNEQKYFTYIARIDRWKQQYLLLESLNILKEKGIDFPKVFFIGQIYNKIYYNEMVDYISENNLGEKVEIVGEVSQSEAQYLLKNSVATFSLYQFSNLGNVFLESLALQTPMIAININNSLDEIPDNCYLQLANHDPEKIAKKIEEILSNKIDITEIKMNASDYASKCLLTWQARVDFEKEIIYDEVLN